MCARSHLAPVNYQDTSLLLYVLGKFPSEHGTHTCLHTEMRLLPYFTILHREQCRPGISVRSSLADSFLFLQCWLRGSTSRGHSSSTSRPIGSNSATVRAAASTALRTAALSPKSNGSSPTDRPFTRYSSKLPLTHETVFRCLSTQIPDLRLLFPNGSLWFPPFSNERHRHDVHGAVYRCRLRSALGTVLSKEVHVKAGM